MQADAQIGAVDSENCRGLIAHNVQKAASAEKANRGHVVCIGGDLDMIRALHGSIRWHIQQGQYGG